MIEKLYKNATLHDKSAWGVVLIWSSLLVLPFGRLVEVPVLMMALLGAILLIQNRRTWRNDRRLPLFVSVFAVSWLPMLLSLPDAVNVSKSIQVVLNHLRFLLFGVFVLHVLDNQRAWRLLERLIGWLLMFWIIDALVQYYTGTDLFGIKPYPGRLSAMFGPDNTKFGLTLAVFLPILWELTRRHLGNIATVLIIIITVTVVIFTGQRAAWIMVFAGAGIYVFCLSFWIRILPMRALAILFIGSLIYVSSSYLVSKEFQSGFDRSLAIFSELEDSLNNSIVHRFWIWKGAWSMIKANPLNGVGARGFRYAFEDYADPDDPYLRLDPPVVPTHSHQLLIEIGAETGMIGLVGLLIMWTLLIRAAIFASDRERVRIFPYAICVGAAFFPLNTHLAIYSAYWSQIVWYLIAIYCAASVGKTDSSAAINASVTRPEAK